MNTNKINQASLIFARLALSASFLSAVADRFGIWGHKGETGVVWGNFDSFLEYTAFLNPWAPTFLINPLGYLVTFLEIIFAAFLILGIKIRLISFLSFVLLSIFAFSMTLTGGLKGPLDYNVFTAAATSLLLFRLTQFENFR